MGYGYTRANFSLRPQYSIDLEVTTSFSSGSVNGTQAYVIANGVKHTAVNNAPTSSGSPRSYSVPSGRTLSVDGTVTASGNDSNWSFTFTTGSVPQYQPIYSGFNRYIRHADRSNVSVTITASHSLLGSASATVTLPHVHRTYFDANGGSVSTSSIDADSGSSITLPTPTRSGYTFNGWYTASSGGTFVGSAGGSSTVSATRTVYAQWTLQSTTYTINYNGNGNTGGSTTATSTTSANSSVNLTVASNGFTKTGHSFSGWYTKSTVDGTGTFYFPGNTLTLTSSSPSITLYAIWGVNTFTISYNANGGTGATSDTTWSYPTSSGILRSSNFSRSGYNFIGWNTNSGATTASYQPGDTYSYDLSSSSGSVTMYAIWQISTITPNWGTGDTTITTTAILNNPYENTASDRTVSASVSSGGVTYSLQSPSSGTSALSWLSINGSTGQLSGTPTAQGVYRFRVRATSSTNTTADTSDLQITVIPAGQRITSSTDEVSLQWAKRFIGIGQTTTNAQGILINADAQGYVLLTRMMRWNGSIWENI